MASVCGGSLALLDAGVRLREPVSGVAMGLVTGGRDGSSAVLTDIMGMEVRLKGKGNYESLFFPGLSRRYGL